MAHWNNDYAARDGEIDWPSLLVIVLVIFGLFLEALWAS